MGVPALFRWLSKKYPKIVSQVVEEEPTRVPDADGNLVELPMDTSTPNPNGFELDCLYLDMNGIVHPCTHPEGKPAPETEEDMMVEVFNYTDRVVSMARPRKLLFMAIDGVAPRAKMNQQRSRRFRAAQEAKEKEEERKEAIKMFEALGHSVSEETTKKAWDSNAITPGTPFMDLLAQSLRYWVVQKQNSDPGWKNLQVIISDASVPGEGEHKIMDFIRRQRVNPGHDPNTRHVIYGLDADLIMLALATHEPHFRVLREDVFADSNKNSCRICGQEGHFAAQCTGKPKEKDTSKPPEKKPFIFLDVAVLREYLAIELNVPNIPFAFDLERAIDDWVFLIFFVGNDFLPHLPSLEIREGAIDTLLKIWKDELPRMGGYLAEHGQANKANVQIMLEGLAKREDEIFRKRREGPHKTIYIYPVQGELNINYDVAEERQEQNAKRRKVEQQRAKEREQDAQLVEVTQSSSAPSGPHGLPSRPTFDVFTGSSLPNNPTFGGSNSEVVANRAALRLANLSAADAMRAELAGATPLKPSSRATPVSKLTISAPVEQVPTPEQAADSKPEPEAPVAASEGPEETGEPDESVNPQPMDTDIVDGAVEALITSAVDRAVEPEGPRGIKRSVEEIEKDETDTPAEDEEPTVKKALKVNPDGTVEQEDTIKLWEPGYKERYYRSKFGAELNDTELRKQITTSYMEGLCWVLQYYYQGAPSWTWFYPYHFAPFAADFEDVEHMDIKFNLGQPFKPYEQLMGVFPAASRVHIPTPFQSLMTDEDSPIIDFYPTEFEIDMNGKKMSWQGVALLPFIDEKRLLGAMAERYPELSDDEVRRNKWGSNHIYVSDGNDLYDFFCGLYTKQRSEKPIPLDTRLSRGISGTVLHDPACVPDSSYPSPLTRVGLPDIVANRTLSAQFYYPRQITPHRSILLPGARLAPKVLGQADAEHVMRGGESRRGGRGRGGGRGGTPRDAGFVSSTGGYSDRPGAYERNGSRFSQYDSYNGGYGSGYSGNGGPGGYAGYGGNGGGGGYGGYGGGNGGDGGHRGGNDGYRGGGGGGRGGYNGYDRGSAQRGARGGLPRGGGRGGYNASGGYGGGGYGGYGGRGR
ncbi:5'-3' exoribonuclease 2 [Rhizoctonia solani]|uniref:5'-3' exoribonuclease n=1 Tax=Rhizoctonia solani TaxID=456999 RepID=A0A8H7HDC5_9AGAM|nr:XRN 5'-3' exonuclease N-terminus [Rhizoctonia solani]